MVDARRWEVKGMTMTMTAFILIVGLVLLTMAAISDAIALLNWMYEQDRKHKHKGGKKRHG